MQQMQKAWADFGSQMVGGTTQTYATALDRTYGALGDALGLGPMRKLQSAGQEIIAAAIAQNEARAGYAMLVQSAIAAGLQKLLQRLADMAQKNERVDSVLALMRMWAVATEEAVHEILQSSRGLEATAAVTRAGLAYRRKTQAFAGIIADTLDMATRRDLDEAYREIQALKRELRSMRAAASADATPTKSRARETKRTTTK
jgi:polyhydroxyalkanoate synthesis regulator phasin